MPNPRPVGNRTLRRGKKLRRDIHLGESGARTLRLLANFRRGLNPAATEDQIVEELIDAAWRKLDAELTEDAETTAWEGEIL
ncbi:MAG: hypothetical protein M3R61_01440 [Chloroflexota bacterium]|nr:hypothetical protein [Chloroflexota bacterium]